MAGLLLFIIYISFISLGLPDSLLGAGWPQIHKELGVSVASAGAISLIIYCGTIVSSFFSEKIIRRFGTGKTTLVSVSMTALGLFAFAFSSHFIWLIFAAIPLGLGAGAVDSALNNFVALHYKAKHMSWLHCFWGIGATAGPNIMSAFLPQQSGWRNGYLTIGIIQACLVALLLISLPLWKKRDQSPQSEGHVHKSLNIRNVFGLKGAKSVLLVFLCYCGLEATTGLWGSTYLVNIRGISVNNAAQYVSLYYLGITAGRFLAGFLTTKLSNKKLIRYGIIFCIAGVALLIIPLSSVFMPIGICMLGIGSAPIFPCMLHETPARFGKEVSQSLMGIQMAFAYAGSTFIPPLFGLIGNSVGMILFPIFMILLIIVMLICFEIVNCSFNKVDG